MHLMWCPCSNVAAGGKGSRREDDLRQHFLRNLRQFGPSVLFCMGCQWKEEFEGAKDCGQLVMLDYRFRR